MIRRLLLIAALMSAVTLLSACVVLEPRGGSAGISDAGTAIVLGPALDDFFVSGRLSLRQGDRRDFLKFDWQHGPAHDTVLLLTPLGQGVAELIRDDSGARLLRPGELPVVASDIAMLMSQLLGTAMPLDELGHWLSGRRGVSGSVAGWHVAVTQTMAHPSSPQGSLPRRLEATRDDVSLTLIVDEWAEGDRPVDDKKL